MDLSKFVLVKLGSKFIVRFSGGLTVNSRYLATTSLGKVVLVNIEFAKEVETKQIALDLAFAYANNTKFEE